MRWDYAHEIYNFVKILTPKNFLQSSLNHSKCFGNTFYSSKAAFWYLNQPDRTSGNGFFTQIGVKLAQKCSERWDLQLCENFDPQKNVLQSSPNGHTHPLRYHDACSRTWETVYLPNTYFALLFLHWPFFDVIPCTLCLCHCLVSPLNTCFNFFVVLCRRGCWWCTGCILLY